MKTDPSATIAVVGASARAAVFSLLRAGYQVMAADLFADADLARCCPLERITPYPEGFASWLANADCHEWVYTGALENHADLVDQLAAVRPLAGHDGAVLRRVRNPLVLQSTLREASFCFPETRLAEVVATKEVVARHESWLRKSYAGSSGSGVGDAAHGKYLQHYVAGDSLAAIFSDNQLLGVTRQLVGEPWTGAKNYKYCGSIGPWPMAKKHLDQLSRLGSVLAEKFSLEGIYGVDFIFDGDLIWPLEVNPRYTASIEVLELANGISVFDQAQLPSSLNCSINDRGLREFRGKAIVYAEQPLIVTPALADRLLQKAGNFSDPKLADIPRGGTKIDVGQPVLTVFSKGESCDSVEQQLLGKTQEIQHEIYGVAKLCD